MIDILIAIGILGGLGLIFGLVLAAASKVFYVETDPRLDQLNGRMMIHPSTSLPSKNRFARHWRKCTPPMREILPRH